MKRTMLMEHLVQAEQHVQLGERHVADQRLLIARLDQDGIDSEHARELLADFEALLIEHIAHRDRLRQELAKAE